MNNFNKRTIQEVLNKEDGKTIDADIFFNKSKSEIWKRRIELQEVIKGIREPIFVCYYCSQNIKINGGIGFGKKILHFAHQKDKGYCVLKTDTLLTKEEINRVKYNGAKESPLHFEAKNLIKKLIELNNDFSNVEVEKVVKNNSNYLEWRRPDVKALYKNVEVVFEIQLSTTFLSVIVDREHFYKQNQTYLLWIFRNFEIDDLKQRFTEKDVFYSNNRNAFVLDDEAVNLSLQNNDLFLLCYYQKPKIEISKIDYDWCFEYVNFSQLTFDEVNYKIFYFDVEKEEKKVAEELEEILEKDRIEKKRVEDELRIKRFEEEQKLEELRIEREKKWVEFQSERDDFFNNQQKYLREKQKAIEERNNLFKEINKDFYFRLKLNYSNHSKYQKTLLLPITELPDALYSLFATGYILTEKDTEFLKVEFKIEKEKKTKNREMEMIYFLSLTTFYIKLKTVNNMFLLPKLERILFSILSFKINKIIGYSFDNLIQVAHHTFSKKESFQVFLNSIEAYYGIEKLLKEDKNKKLINKLIEYKNSLPKQNTEFDGIIKLVFPEAINNRVEIENFV